eukprot:ANDGO_05541.mRNA.1 hypothetical protein PPTG_14323
MSEKDKDKQHQAWISAASLGNIALVSELKENQISDADFDFPFPPAVSSSASASITSAGHRGNAVHGLPQMMHRDKMAVSFSRKRDVAEFERKEAKTAAVPTPAVTKLSNFAAKPAENQTEEEVIHLESEKMLSSLSPEQIAEAQQEIQHIFPPDLLAFLKERGAGRAGVHSLTGPANSETMGPSATKQTVLEPRSDDDHAAAAKHVHFQEIVQVKQIPSTSFKVVPRTYEELIEYLKGIPEEREKIQWMLEETNELEQFDVAVPGTVSSWRFGPDGKVNEELSKGGDAAAGRSDLFHHGGDQRVPGYSLSDLERLSRSAVDGQRIYALTALSAIATRAKSGGYSEDVFSSLVAMHISMVARKNIDSKNMNVIVAGLQLLEAILATETTDELLDTYLLARLRFLLESYRHVSIIQSSVFRVLEFMAKHDEESQIALIECDGLVESLAAAIEPRAFRVLAVIASISTDHAHSLIELGVLETSYRYLVLPAPEPTLGTVKAKDLELASSILEMWRCMIAWDIERASWQPFFGELSNMASYPLCDIAVFDLLQTSISLFQPLIEDVRLMVQMMTFVKLHARNRKAWTFVSTYLLQAHSLKIQEICENALQWPFSDILRDFCLAYDATSVAVSDVLSFGKLVVAVDALNSAAVSPEVVEFLRAHASQSPSIAGFVISAYSSAVDAHGLYISMLNAPDFSKDHVVHVVLNPAVLRYVFGVEARSNWVSVLRPFLLSLSDDTYAERRSCVLLAATESKSTDREVLGPWLTFLAAAWHMVIGFSIPYGRAMHAALRFFIISDRLFQNDEIRDALERILRNAKRDWIAIARELCTEFDTTLVHDFAMHFAAVSFGDETFAKFVSLLLHPRTKPEIRLAVLRGTHGCQHFLDPLAVGVTPEKEVNVGIVQYMSTILLEGAVSRRRGQALYQFLVGTIRATAGVSEDDDDLDGISRGDLESSSNKELLEDLGWL